jgi:hypothetical protein
MENEAIDTEPGKSEENKQTSKPKAVALLVVGCLVLVLVAVAIGVGVSSRKSSASSSAAKPSAQTINKPSSALTLYGQPFSISVQSLVNGFGGTEILNLSLTNNGNATVTLSSALSIDVYYTGNNSYFDVGRMMHGGYYVGPNYPVSIMPGTSSTVSFDINFSDSSTVLTHVAVSVDVAVGSGYVDIPIPGRSDNGKAPATTAPPTTTPAAQAAPAPAPAAPAPHPAPDYYH